MGSEAKPHRRQLRDPKIAKIASFSELRAAGFVPYLLGPVYAYGKVEEDLAECFAGEMNRDVAGTFVHFDRPVVARCEHWNNVLSVMDAVNFLWFKDWMMKLQLADKQRKKFYLVRHYVAPIVDPFMLDQIAQVQAESVDIFSVSGMGGLLQPKGNLASYADAKQYVDFDQLPPEEEVKVLGRAALEILGG